VEGLPGLDRALRLCVDIRLHYKKVEVIFANKSEFAKQQVFGVCDRTKETAVALQRHIAGRFGCPN